MNLSNFKSKISPVIFERGEDYYHDNAVKDLQMMENGQCFAIVEGTDDYEVDISLTKKGEIIEYLCNCPYDGEVCKHVVAVLLAIEADASVAPDKRTRKKIPEWQQIVQNLPEDELRDFVTGFAMKNKKLQNDLMINFPMLEQKDNSGKYRKMITEVFNAAAGRHGMIEYGHTYAAMLPVHSLLAKAEEHIEKANFREAFSIASAIAPECIEAIQFMDDSNGECGGVIEEAFQIIDILLKTTNNTGFANEVYEWLYGQMQNNDYENYGCCDSLEDVFFKWSDRPERLLVAYSLIDQQIMSVESEKSWNAEYKITKYLQYKMMLLQKEGKGAEIERLIDENIHISDFRKIRVEQYIEQNDHKRAIQLINEGIKIADQNREYGTVRQWKKKLLDIYQATNNSTQQRAISKDLFSDNPDSIEYFQIYKGTFSDADWAQAREEIITNLKPKKSTHFFGNSFSHHLAQVYIEEKMWNRLFEEVQSNNSIQILSHYTKCLRTNYSTELVSLYRDRITNYAQNTGRKIYKELVGYLKQMAGLKGGLPEAKLLKAELLDTYQNRRAMKDEFGKLWS